MKRNQFSWLFACHLIGGAAILISIYVFGNQQQSRENWLLFSLGIIIGLFPKWCIKDEILLEED
jgi:hypothetical protein